MRAAEAAKQASNALSAKEKVRSPFIFVASWSITVFAPLSSTERKIAILTLCRPPLSTGAFCDEG